MHTVIYISDWLALKYSNDRDTHIQEMSLLVNNMSMVWKRERERITLTTAAGDKQVEALKYLRMGFWLSAADFCEQKGKCRSSYIFALVLPELLVAIWQVDVDSSNSYSLRLYICLCSVCHYCIQQHSLYVSTYTWIYTCMSIYYAMYKLLWWMMMLQKYVLVKPNTRLHREQCIDNGMYRVDVYTSDTQPK